VRSIYFDYNATTPLDQAVHCAMAPYLLNHFGNPSSLHHVGRHARVALDDARDRFAQVWKCKPSEVVFTSGGTESNNLALFGTARHLRSKGRHIITSAIEHHAVLHSCRYLQKHEGFDVSYLPVNKDGHIATELVANALRSDTILVSIMAANNEIGSIQPVAEIGALCRSRGIIFHTDAVQWFGKEPFSSIHQFNADLVTLCGHKFHGPKGAGALFIKSPLQPDPILFGGGHENDRRAGTENVAFVVGLAEALDRFVRKPVFPSDLLRSLTLKLTSCLTTLPGITMLNPPERCLSNTLAFATSGCDSISLLATLDLAGICASSGAACSAGSLEPSHVAVALGIPLSPLSAFIRFSLGRENSMAEVDYVCSILPDLIRRTCQ
jgi:cysteine desulfurase